MAEDNLIIDLEKNNFSQYNTGLTCFLNIENEGPQKKIKWAKKEFSEGMKIKLLYSGKDKKFVGFIECIPGENAWRAVDAPGYLFIHCIWIYPNKYKKNGNASLLIKECIKEAKKEEKYGVAVVASEGPFMVGKDIFIKNGFKIIETTKPSYNLIVKTLKKGPLPKFKDWEKQLSKYKGLNLIYADQCPWVARSIEILNETAAKKGLKLKITKLKTAKQAQNAPTPYGVFALIYDGKLLADHYISNTRFLNILNKEIQM